MRRVLPQVATTTLADEIRHFVESSDPLGQSPPEVDQLISSVYQFQLRHDPAYRRLCEARGVMTEEDLPWNRIPMVPTAAFKSKQGANRSRSRNLDWRDTGLSKQAARPSVKQHAPCTSIPFPELYRSIISAGYSAYCLAGFSAPPPTLSLIPALSQITDSSLGFMADHILAYHAAADSVIAFGTSGVDLDAAVAFLEQRRNDQRPAMILTTAFALVELLDHLAAGSSHSTESLFLPSGSALFETGGFKGRTRQISRAELVAQTQRVLGLPPQSIVREYGMTELSSQMYSTSLLAGDPELLVAPPWLRTGVFDPNTLEPARDGEEGLIGFFDLGNVGSYPAVMTEDLGRMHDQGLELLGRASQSELRGCSLTVEELQSAAGKTR